MTDKTEAMDNLIAQDADLIDTNDKDSAVLLPCPFCGGVQIEAFHYIDRGWGASWHVECVAEECGNSTCHHDTEATAIAAWNKRQPTQSDNNFHKLALSESFERVAKVAKEREAFNEQMTKDPAAEWQAGYEAGIRASANALEADAKKCDCFARNEGECGCGAWCEWKSITSARAVEIVRALKELG